MGEAVLEYCGLLVSTILHAEQSGLILSLPFVITEESAREWERKERLLRAREEGERGREKRRDRRL